MKWKELFKKTNIGTIYLIPQIFFNIIIISILGIVTYQGYPLGQVIIPKSYLKNKVLLWSSGAVLL